MSIAHRLLLQELIQEAEEEDGKQDIDEQIAALSSSDDEAAVATEVLKTDRVKNLKKKEPTIEPKKPDTRETGFAALKTSSVPKEDGKGGESEDEDAAGTKATGSSDLKARSESKEDGKGEESDDEPAPGTQETGSDREGNGKDPDSSSSEEEFNGEEEEDEEGDKLSVKQNNETTNDGEDSVPEQGNRGTGLEMEGGGKGKRNLHLPVRFNS